MVLCKLASHLHEKRTNRLCRARASLAAFSLLLSLSASSGVAHAVACDDGIDNDTDGMVDLADAGCLADPSRDDETGEIVVNSTDDQVDADTGDGICETVDGGGECTVRAAIMQANATPGLEGVQVPAGMHELALNPVGGSESAADGDLDVTDDLVLVGAGEASTRIGGPLGRFWDRIVEVAPGTQVTISSMTILRGDASSGGAGISNRGDLVLTSTTVSGSVVTGSGGGIANLAGGTLMLTNSTVSGNRTSFGNGGGIANYADLVITNSTLSDNDATSNGGGIANFGNLTLTNSTLSGNGTSFDDGGGILNGGTLVLTNSTLSDNYAFRFGGGIHNVAGGTLTLTSSTLSGNGAYYYGGGIHNSGAMDLTNSTLSGNFAADYGFYTSYSGGGIFNDSPGPTTLTNSTLNGNSANSGGGIFNTGQGSVMLTNSALSQSSSENCIGGGIASVGNNLSDDLTCALAGAGDLENAPALLGPLADNGGPTETHLPMPGSPLIDAGSNANCPASDQRGIARPQDGDTPPDGSSDCDIGAVELLPEPGFPLLLGSGGLLLLALGRRRTWA